MFPKKCPVFLGTVLLPFFAVLFSLGLSCGVVCDAAADTADNTAEEKRYIVFPKESDISLLDSARQYPFLTVDEETLRLLSREGLVAWYEEDLEVTLFDEATDENAVFPTDEPYFSQQWGLSDTAVPSAWQFGCYGNGIVVGVIDSGIYPHEDLIENTLAGFNYIENSEEVDDNIGHGTFVSGLIAAQANGKGISGAAPQAKICPLKCFDSGVKTKTSLICKAIYDAVDVYGCDILNMSFGLKTRSAALEKAVAYADENGCILIASVGNDGNDTLYYPAAFDSVIGVGATDENRVPASFSQRNESVFLTAPGKNVLSTDNTGSYSARSGTSFSAPLVSGIVADLLCADETADAKEVKELLKSTCADLGDEGYDTLYGYGLIDTAQCMKVLSEKEDLFLSPPLFVSDETAQFRIFGNTEAFDGYFFVLYYDEKGVLCDLTYTAVSAESRADISVSAPVRYDTVRCFILKDLLGLRPCMKERKIKVRQQSRT